MTKLDQVKADLIDIIGDRKTVKIKEVSHLARSTRLIDELMEKMGYQKKLQAGVYDKNYSIADEMMSDSISLAIPKDKCITVNYLGKPVRFRKTINGNATAETFAALTHGTITTSWFQERDINPQMVTVCLRRRGFNVEVSRLNGFEHVYTLKSPKR